MQYTLKVLCFGWRVHAVYPAVLCTYPAVQSGVPLISSPPVVINDSPLLHIVACQAHPALVLFLRLLTDKSYFLLIVIHLPPLLVESDCGV